MKQLVYLFLLLALTLSARISQAAEPPGWVEDTKIIKVSVQPNGNLYITLEKTVPNLGCQLHHSGILQLDTSSPNFDEQYSLIIAAFMAEKNVSVYVSGCGNAYPYAQNTNVSH